MHKALSNQYYLQQLQAVIIDPILADRGVEIEQGEDQSFTLRVQKRGTYLCPVARFDCSNFDIEPPLVEFVDPVTRQKLPDHFWPSTVGDHQIYGRAICLRETRGYHYHQTHQHETFDNYRNGFSLLRLVIEVIRRIDDMWSFPGGGPYEC